MSDEWIALSKWRTWDTWRHLCRHLHLVGLARGLVYSWDGTTRILGLGHHGGYILWKPTWWWECHRQQGFRIVGRHRPRQPWIMWTCAACLPCVECDAIYECVPSCMTGGEAALCPPQPSASTGEVAS